MTTYNVGADRTGGAGECVQKVCQILQEKGHTVNNLGVNPNLEGSLKTGSKEHIGVFIVNGICLGTFLSVNEMVQAGGCGHVIFGIPKPLMASPFNDKSNFSNNQYTLKLINDGSNWKQSWYPKYDKKYTVDGIMSELSGISYAWGETCEEVAESILNGGTATSGDGTGSDGTSSDDTKEPTPMSYRDMIKDLISVWDGDVECKIRQDKIFINKVPQPKPQLWIVDGTNVVSKQAKVKDYNSDTINTLNVLYDSDNHYINITDEYLINRFGEVEALLTAEKIVTDYSGDGSTDGSTDGSADGSTDSSDKSSKWTEVATILQKYYDKPNASAKDGGWNSIIRAILGAKKYDPDIRNQLTKLKKKKGYEHKSYVDVGHDLCDVLKITF